MEADPRIGTAGSTLRTRHSTGHGAGVADRSVQWALTVCAPRERDGREISVSISAISCSSRVRVLPPDRSRARPASEIRERRGEPHSAPVSPLKPHGPTVTGTTSTPHSPDSRRPDVPRLPPLLLFLLVPREQYLGGPVVSGGLGEPLDSLPVAVRQSRFHAVEPYARVVYQACSARPGAVRDRHRPRIRARWASVPGDSASARPPHSRPRAPRACGSRGTPHESSRGRVSRLRTGPDHRRHRSPGRDTYRICVTKLY